MIRLFLIIYTLASTTLAGVAIIAALTVGRVDAVSIIVAAVAGAALALPVSWFVAKALMQQA
jgi:hypothetical protein